MFFWKNPCTLTENPLVGRPNPLSTQETHSVIGCSLHPPFPAKTEVIYLAMGCFWGVERLFWQQDGVYVTAVGYAGGQTPNPTYNEVCTGKTNHTEVVMVVYDPSIISLQNILKLFWENHDPTQGMRQRNDLGTQYRSAIYTTTQPQFDAAHDTLGQYQRKLRAENGGTITTEIKQDQTFYYAEAEHQQYLHKTPGGYCNMQGTGVCLGK